MPPYLLSRTSKSTYLQLFAYLHTVLTRQPKFSVRLNMSLLVLRSTKARRQRMCETWDGAPNLYQDQRFDVKASELLNGSELARHMEDETSHVSWVDLSRTATVSPSIAVAIQFPPCDDSPAAIYACTVDARWLPTRIWSEPTADIPIHTTRGNYWSLLTSMADDPAPAEPIRLGAGWLAGWLHSTPNYPRATQPQQSRVSLPRCILTRVRSAAAEPSSG